MAKVHRPAVDYAVYVAVRLVVCVLQALPPAGARAVALGLAWLAHRVDRRHRTVARDNLRHAFPGRYPDAELDALVRAVYRHFCTVGLEIVRLPRKLHVTNWRDFVELDAGGRMVDVLTCGRPVLMVTGHFGNWEMGGYVLGLFGFRTSGVARRLDNPHLDRFLLRFRQGTGQTILDKNTDYLRIQQVLATGGVLGMLADQDAGARALFVDFFGRPASTFKSIALLALEYNALLMVMGVPKVGEPMRYRVVCEDVIDPAEYADRPDAAKAITQRYTAALERLVRRHPDQYFWLHRRWKHQPPARRAKAA
jgi:Kdo2-lipid IVA lauroyltransferase/acyltransferase